MQEPVHDDPPECVCESFPDTWFYPKVRLVCWFPQGVIKETLCDQFIEYIEFEESDQKAPFDRYFDFSGATEARIGIDYIIRTARRRRTVRQPSKSAFFVSKPPFYRSAQMYEMLMGEAMIDVRAFRERAAAAQWLEVPVEVLNPPVLNDERKRTPATLIREEFSTTSSMVGPRNLPNWKSASGRHSSVVRRIFPI